MKERPVSKWKIHLARFYREHPEMSYKEAMKEASKSYHPDEIKTTWERKKDKQIKGKGITDPFSKMRNVSYIPINPKTGRILGTGIDDQIAAHDPIFRNVSYIPINPNTGRIVGTGVGDQIGAASTGIGNLVSSLLPIATMFL